MRSRQSVLRIGFVWLGLLLIVAGCGDVVRPVDTTAEPTSATMPESTAATAAGIPPVQGEVVTTASGLQYIDIAEGTGASPTLGDQVVVHYTGYLDDGTIFDSSVQRGQPAQFMLGQVIEGWNEGLSTMKVGGKRRLIIPPELAYGATGQGPVPPNARLTFDVELLDVPGK